MRNKQKLGFTLIELLIVIAILAILAQLGIARGFVETLFTGIVAMLVIAAGIAFGLGGKDVAGDLLKGVRDKFRE